MFNATNVASFTAQTRFDTSVTSNIVRYKMSVHIIMTVSMFLSLAVTVYFHILGNNSLCIEPYRLMLTTIHVSHADILKLNVGAFRLSNVWGVRPP